MIKLTWSDLLVEEVSPDDLMSWLRPWSQVIGGSVALVFMNKFGVWFLRRPEGPVDMLDVLSGNLISVAESYDQFVERVNDPAWQETFLLSKLVYRLHEEGKIPAAGQCYALAPHPAFGTPNPMKGEPLDTQHVMVLPIKVWQHFCVQSVLGHTGDNLIG